MQYCNNPTIHHNEYKTMELCTHGNFKILYGLGTFCYKFKIIPSGEVQLFRPLLQNAMSVIIRSISTPKSAILSPHSFQCPNIYWLLLHFLSFCVFCQNLSRQICSFTYFYCTLESSLETVPIWLRCCYSGCIALYYSITYCHSSQTCCYYNIKWLLCGLCPRRVFRTVSSKRNPPQNGQMLEVIAIKIQLAWIWQLVKIKHNNCFIKLYVLKVFWKYTNNS